MSVVDARIFANTYRDSVELMQIAAEVEGLDGIERAGLVMATPANREVLAAAGLLVDSLASAGPNDLVAAVSASGPDAAAAALDRAAERLRGVEAEGSGEATRTDLRTIAEAVTDLGTANMVLISTPGDYATAEALKALKRGLNVFMFSDNVPVADEIELKRLALERGLLVMGPDCGTAILDGVPLGFANAVRRGSVGLVAASGTGLQQVSCLVHRAGAGVSQAIGVGGRDLDERVGGVMMLDGLRRLVADPGTEVIVLISKPPAEAVAERILAAAGAAGKPVIVNFLGGDPASVRAAGALPASTFEEAAAIASAIALEHGPVAATSPGSAAADPVDGHPTEAEASADAAAERLAEGQTRIRGLYSGGSLAGEAKLLIKAALGPDRARAHEILDLGDDEYTVGRPHPMIDPRLRNEYLRAAALDPTTAVILLDVVLGFGANMDPAGALAAEINSARAALAEEGRTVAIVASVCGTDADPQGLAGQEAALEVAGVLLAPSNARAARLAARIADRAGSAAEARA